MVEVVSAGTKVKDLNPVSNIQMYNDYPKETVPINDLYEACLSRVKLLQTIDDASNRFEKLTSDYYNMIITFLKSSGHWAFFEPVTLSHVKNVSPQDLKERRRRVRVDIISHFVCRLAFCRTYVYYASIEFFSAELRSWFIKQEVELFKLRYEKEGLSARNDFLRENFRYEDVTDQLKSRELDVPPEVCDYLLALYRDNERQGMNHVYKVPFLDAIRLLKHRKACLHQGLAYVFLSDALNVVANNFRMNLSFALATYSRYIGRLSEDPRIVKLVNSLGNLNSYTGTDYANARPDDAVTPEMVDTLCQESFPLCMRHIHENLRSTHHLKHVARLQYGLFLKGIGMSLEDSLKFWMQEFTKTMERDKFEKQYSYNIRYNYGKEGKRINYTPYSCLKIITSNLPGPQECHGCPFKQNSHEVLTKKLKAMNLRDVQTDVVMEKVRNHNYQSACTRVFEFTHGMSENSADTVGHPNQYFDMSRKIRTEPVSKEVKQENVDLS